MLSWPVSIKLNFEGFFIYYKYWNLKHIFEIVTNVGSDEHSFVELKMNYPIETKNFKSGKWL